MHKKLGSRDDASLSGHYAQIDGIAVILGNASPAHGLGVASRRLMAEGLARAAEDSDVLAVVLMVSAEGISGSMELSGHRHANSQSGPTLSSLIEHIEDAGKPVVAALYGVVLGVGLELAMACHYRVAAPGTRLALPDVRLGLVPICGGLQRLPRLVGIDAAIDMAVTGSSVTCETLAQWPRQQLIHRLIEGDVLPGAIRFAQEIRGARPLLRARDIEPVHPDFHGCFAAMRASIESRWPLLTAPLRALDCIEQAIWHPYDSAVAYARRTCLQLLAGAESRALRHVHLAERAAGRLATDVTAAAPIRDIASAAIIGAGTMGVGIAMGLLELGLAVTLLETRTSALAAAVDTVRRIYETAVARGALSRVLCQQRMAQLTTTLHYEDIRHVDLVVESVFEAMSVKKAVFERLDAVMRPGSILASNTSTLDLNRIAVFTRRPQDVVGMHFFTPVHAMQLVEIGRGDHTAVDVLATVGNLLARMGKTSVVTDAGRGLIGSRMVDAYMRQAGFLLDEGAEPHQVDEVIEQFGFTMGPFRASDLFGNDIACAVRARRNVQSPEVRYSSAFDRLCDMGRFGRKTRAGWYDYEPGMWRAVSSAAVRTMLARHRQSLGITPRRISRSEIENRLLYALVNEGARMLGEGVAGRASDIDLVCVAGCGFPRHRGGPMHHAEECGFAFVVQTMRAFALNPYADPGFWEPAPLLCQLAAGQEID